MASSAAAADPRRPHEGVRRVPRRRPRPRRVRRLHRPGNFPPPRPLRVPPPRSPRRLHPRRRPLPPLAPRRRGRRRRRPRLGILLPRQLPRHSSSRFSRPAPRRRARLQRAPGPGACRALRPRRRRRRQLLLQRRPVPIRRRELARHHPGHVRPLASRRGAHPGVLPRRDRGVGRTRHRRGARRDGAALRGSRHRRRRAGGGVVPRGESDGLPLLPGLPRAVGIVPHTDPGVLTVLAQDGVGGLQVKHTTEDGESYWVDAKPVPGALLINVGDLLQIMSNDKYKSVEHRIVMNSHEEARVSSAIFFNPGKRGDSVFYGPLPELVSSENPPKYRNFTMSEFFGAFFKRDLASKALIEHFKI